MRTLLLLSLLVAPVALAQVVTGVDAPVAAVSFKWEKSRQVVAVTDTQGVIPAPAMIPQNKNFAREARINDPAGVRDPNLDTIDGRAAALEQNVQDARAPKSKTVDGYLYRVKLRNAGAGLAEVVFWEYDFTESANPANVSRRQFLCAPQLKAGKERELSVFSASAPSGVISAGSLTDKTAASPFQEKVVINRIEYADGTIWQRKGWNFADVRAGVAQATATPWGAEVCRGL
jgi:hypothetical protein